MHLIVEQYGTFVSKHQGRLRVEKDKQRLAEVPIMHLEQLLICSNGVGISSDVVRVCAEEGIPIHFLNGSAGDDYGTLFASGLTGMALTRRAQLRAYEDERGLALSMQSLLIYDIPDDRARQRVADACLDYGLERIQYSAFCGDLTRTHQRALFAEIKRRLGRKAGNVQLFPLDAKAWSGRREIAQGADDD